MAQNNRQFYFNFKIWIEDDMHNSILGDGKWQLLKAIDETGSLKDAMIQMDLTYRKTWDNLRRIEQKLGFPIIETERGGADGGRTVLSPQGKKIVALFDDFHQQVDVQLKEIAKKFSQQIADIV
ncbi:MAG: LysR family transcriptional regulator [Ignavibacteria bacterium]|nr:LysR family transcriptional regulator [Ignavibacteria bacterium]